MGEIESEFGAGEQTTLLDLGGRELNSAWIDEKVPLYIANNPLHWKAHKLQIAIARMDKIAQNNPAQFNATAYFAALDRLSELMEKINQGATSAKILDTGDVGGLGDDGAASQDSEIEPISMDS